ncbi:MAG: Sec-independent protein translocase protein TatB [Rhodospirillales bacterium]
MLDIGGAELLVIAVVALVVLGPKELPGAIRTVSMWTRRARELAREFQGGLDDIAREVEIDKMKAELRASIEADELKNTIRNEFDELGRDVERTVDPERDVAALAYGPPAPPQPYDADLAQEIAKTPAEEPPPGDAERPAHDPVKSGTGS